MTWDEEGAGRALGTRLKLMDAPAHRVEMDAVVRAGRRSTRLRRWGTGAAVLALAGAVAVPVAVRRDPSSAVDPTASASAAPVRDADCTVEELPRPAGSDHTIEQVDPTGRIMLGISGGASTLLVWRDGQVSTLAVPGISPPWPLHDVTADGLIVGTHLDRPWTYREGGTVEWLALPPGYTSGSATTINGNGDLAGNVAALQSIPGRYSRAAIWPADARDRPVVLEPDQDSVAFAIGPDGTVAGALLNYSGHFSHAVVWTPSGDRRVLDLPAGAIASSATHLGGDFAYGYVTMALTPEPDDATTPGTSEPGAAATPRVGTVPERPHPDRPARWNLRTGTVEVLSTLPGRVAAAAAGGWFVVVSDPGSPVVVSPTLRMAKLPMPPWADPARDTVVDVKWVSTDGKTVAGNVPVPGQGHRPVVWRCR